MNEDDVVTIVRAHIERKFPMTCSKCGRRFASLRDYLLNTTHVGSPVSYDAELTDWRPRLPIGTMSFANCRCGTTLSISSQGMGLMAMWRLLRWARKESLQRNISTRELLDGVRSKIDRQVLAESEDMQTAEGSH
ncbi:MAG: hypothetical protein ACWGPN_16295 [Gammaproteobacteria bacterium]